MVAIAFVTTSGTAGGDLLKVSQAFIDKGHTVTRFNHNAVTLSDLLPFKLIVCCRPDSGTPAYNAVIKNALQAGVPVMCGPSAGNWPNITVPVACGLLSEITTDSIAAEIYPMVAHPVFTAASIPINQAMTVSTGRATYVARAATSVNKAPSALTLAKMSATDTAQSVVIAEKGTKNLSDETFGAAIAFCGFMWPSNDSGSTMSAQSKALIVAIGEYLMAGSVPVVYKITGTVKNNAGAPIARGVKVLRRSDLTVVAQTTSDATTGVYSLDLPDQNPCIVICLDESDGDKNSLIRDHVIPTNGDATVAAALNDPFFDGQRFIATKVSPSSGVDVYSSNDGAVFTKVANLSMFILREPEDAIAKGSNGYAVFPKHYAETASGAIWDSYLIPDLVGTYPPKTWQTEPINGARPLCIVWDDAGSRYVRIMEDKTVTVSPDGLNWSLLGYMTLPEIPGGWTWYLKMKVSLFRSGGYWYALHSGLGTQYQADSTMLMHSTDLLNWSMCPGTGFYSPPGGGAPWYYFMVTAVAYRQGTIVITAQGSVTQGAPARELILRSTDGLNFSIVYDAYRFNTVGQTDFVEIKPVGVVGFVAAGSGGIFVSSDDGVTWSRTAMILRPTDLRSNGQKVVACRATGSGGTNEIWSTSNGATWTRSTIAAAP